MNLPLRLRLSFFATGLVFLVIGPAALRAQEIPAPAASSIPRYLPPIPARRRSQAEAAYLRGAKQMQSGDLLRAEQSFAHAVTLDPSRPEYTDGLLVAREHRVTSLLQQAAEQRPIHPAKAEGLIAEARAIDSTNPRILQRDTGSAATQTLASPVRQTRPAGTVTLKPNTSLHSYHERGDTRTLATRIAADYGLRAAFDADLPTRPLRLDLDAVGFADALRILLLLTDTMSVPLDDHTFILAAATQANRTRYERLVEETFYLPGFSADQLKDFVSIAQQLLDIRQVSVVPLGGALVLRGPADRVDAVERVFADLLQGKNELVFDVKLYAIDKSHVRNLGIVLPQSFNAFSLSAQAQSVVSQNSSLISQLIASGVLPSTASTLEIAAYLIFVAGIGGSTLLQNSFLLFGGGATTGALSAGNIPTINLALNQSEARSLDDLQLRVSNQEKVIFKSGTRYPIQTSLYSDIASSSASSLAGVTVNGVSLSSLLSSYLGTSSIGSGGVVPQVQYEDLGLTVTATPQIQLTGDVGLKLEVKVSSLSGSAINGIPILNSRQFVSDLTVHNGETVLMMSDTTRNENAAVSGLPGVGDIPGFQSTTNRNGTTASSDLVLLITPHIVRYAHLRSTGPYIPLTPRPGDE